MEDEAGGTATKPQTGSLLVQPPKDETQGQFQHSGLIPGPRRRIGSRPCWLAVLAMVKCDQN